MVAKTPIKEKRMAAALNPSLIRETVKKVDQCMARLQELQYTVNGRTKVVAGVKLSPRSTRGYLRTSLRCKQESIRSNWEWRRMSLPAMLLGETVIEILQASKFAKEIVAKTRTTNDPKTPGSCSTRRNKTKARIHCESTELRTKRTQEKQQLRRSRRFESSTNVIPRAQSRITFKASSPSPSKEKDTRSVLMRRHSVTAQRVSPKNRPWAKKTVLFPNPLFSDSTQQKPEQFYKTRSPIISRIRQQTPRKFLVKSPTTSLKLQFKNNKAVPVVTSNQLPSSSSPVRTMALPKVRRCSFSPSKLANRFISPLKMRKSMKI
ncbi:putative microtubule-binding protein TANGLED1 [Dioscorea sansibarensis]